MSVKSFIDRILASAHYLTRNPPVDDADRILNETAEALKATAAALEVVEVKIVAPSDPVPVQRRKRKKAKPKKR
jgi:hypothetical protein